MQRQRKDELSYQAQLNLRKYSIIVMYYDGLSKHEIAKRLNIQRHYISDVLKKFDQYQSVEYDIRHENVGRPSLFTEEDKTEIKDMIAEQDLRHINEIHQAVTDQMEIECGLSTIYKLITTFGEFIIPSYRLNLSESQRQKRLQYCQKYNNLKCNFQKVIFCDESTFYLNRNTKKLYVLQGEEKPSLPKYNPDHSIMIWAAICYEGFVYLEIVEGKLNHLKYIEVLQRFFNNGLPSVNEENYSRFLQDNAPPHKPQKVKEFIEKNGFILQDFPPNSPDLNPIEMIWSFAKGEVEKLKPSTKEELINSIFTAFDKLPDQYVKNCIDHLPTYLPLVIDEGGGYPRQYLKENNDQN